MPTGQEQGRCRAARSGGSPRPQGVSTTSDSDALRGTGSRFIRAIRWGRGVSDLVEGGVPWRRSRFRDVERGSSGVVSTKDCASHVRPRARPRLSRERPPQLAATLPARQTSSNQIRSMTRLLLAAAVLASASSLPSIAAAQAAVSASAEAEQPNILVIWGDDIGQSNISAYTQRHDGLPTPNIDRIASEGMHFTDYYGSSLHRGRSSFIMGQSVFRTGLARSACPAQNRACRRRTRPSPAAEGSGLRDRAVRQEPPRRPRSSTCRRNHGFDEFFGNLYHLNAEEEPENEDYPKDPDVPREVRAPWRDPRPFAGRTRSRTPAR